MNLTCKICNITFEDNNKLTAHIKYFHKMKIKDYYDNYFKKDNDGICKTCGKPTEFLSLRLGYREYCCNKCVQTSKEIQEKIKKTNQERYGSDYYSKTDKWLNGVKKTNQEKYGCDFAGQNKEVKEKALKTCLEKYGTTTYSQTEECKQKMADTNTKKYGKSAIMQVEEFKEKSVKTCQEKYGKDNVSQVKEIQDKKIETNQQRYGVDWFSNPEKTKETSLKKYGVSNYTKTDEYKEKTIRTNLEKYGVPYYSQSKKWLDETKEICLKKFGVEHPSQNHDIRCKSQQKYLYNMKYFDSSWELAYYIWLKDHNIDFKYQPSISFEYEYNSSKHIYHPDFLVESEIYEIKGPQFFKDGKMINPYDPSLNDLYEAKHQCMIKNNIKIITDCTEYIDYIGEKYGNDYLKQFKYDNIVEMFNNLPEFPYFNITKLSLNSPYAIIQQYHKSIWDAHIKNKPSPKAAWSNQEIMAKVISNRLVYQAPPYTADKIRQGLNVTKLAPKVSVFKPSLGIYLISRYLNDYNEIFDPFSGFSGRMLASVKCDKKYIGQDINQKHVEESNNIITDFKISSASVVQKDILESSGEYDCLFTCPPYENIEQWNDNELIMTCDQWIDECLKRFKCKNYLFVVDNTEKYKNNVVEEICNKSHFGNNKEYIVLI